MVGEVCGIPGSSAAADKGPGAPTLHTLGRDAAATYRPLIGVTDCSAAACFTVGMPCWWQSVHFTQ